MKTNILLILVVFTFFDFCKPMSREEKLYLKKQTVEMFHHAFNNYMDHAYPADELMPLSCKGRYRGVESSRGDIDDVLGNYSLTLIDSLDTLAIIGEFDIFEDSVRKIIRDVHFNNDIVVSVFETNIRVVGGLLGGHLMADLLKKNMKKMLWYENELLRLATDVGNRLIPAFNTSTGMPFPRINLRYGLNPEMSRTGQEKNTCTACAGTMLLEFSALSRLTGNMIYEEIASKAMDYLWKSRHSVSDLMGTVINIQNGDWIRKESGVGAGIDSYYEYLLKAYIMLGDDIYLERFNVHYRAVMKYVNNGPLMLDVHMHRPQTTARNFMDSLLAFWPGLQVLKGDLKPAIEIHEMLYQVMLRHNFIPEAFTSDFRVHWAQHPLRPEFLESTYFLFKATGDHHYLEVGKQVLENLNKIARVKCGFAAIKDVTTGDHEDQMDSFVFAETFKYLFLLFSEKEDLSVNIDDFIFTTEAHLLPLFLSMHKQNQTEDIPQHILNSLNEEVEEFENTCPSMSYLFKGTINYAQDLRSPLKNMVERLCPRPFERPGGHLKATDFIAGNREQMNYLNQMGIRLITMDDGRVQLVHISSEAISPEASHDGMLFMQEMIELSKSQSKEVPLEPRVIQILSFQTFGEVVLKAGPAQFGLNLKNHAGVEGRLARADPYDGCSPLRNEIDVKSKIVIVGRGGCMFIEKVRNIQNAGGLAGIVCDNSESSSTSQYFSMSGDGKTDVVIPAVFLFSEEAKLLNDAIGVNHDLVVYIGEGSRKPEEILQKYDEDAKQSVEVLEQIPDAHVNSKLFDEEIIKDLKFIFGYLNIPSLLQIIQSHGSNFVSEDLSYGSQVKVIRRMPEFSRTDINVDERQIVDEQQHVRRLFKELMFILQKCTNIAKLQLTLEFENKKVADALACLTEYAYTFGNMKFGVETEKILERLKNRIEINLDDAYCLPNHSLLSEVNAERDDDVITSIATNLHIDSKELESSLDEFVDQQVTNLFKELLMPEKEVLNVHHDLSREDFIATTDKVESEGEEHGTSGTGERKSLNILDRENLAAINCNDDGCFEITEKDSRGVVVNGGNENLKSSGSDEMSHSSWSTEKKKFECLNLDVPSQPVEEISNQENDISSVTDTT